MKTIIKIILVACLCLTFFSCKKEEFRISVEYKEGFAFQDFYEKVGNAYSINAGDIQSIKYILSLISEGSLSLSSPELNRIKANISGDFFSRKKDVLYKTTFYTYVFNYEKSNNFFDSLTLYFDKSSGKFISVNCPSEKSNFVCNDSIYPIERGGVIQFD